MPRFGSPPACHHGSGRRSPAARRWPRALALTAATLCLAPCVGSGNGALAASPAHATPKDPEADAATASDRDAAARARFARSMLENARQLERQGRLEAAARTTARGLEAVPDDARLHRQRARVLAALGREDEAARHRARAEALAPTPAKLPNRPQPPDPDGRPAGTGLAVVLLPPPEAQQAAGRAPATWPGGDVHATVVDRIDLRLPGATVLAPPALDEPSVPALRSWIAEQAARATVSLRIDRAYCRDTIKDGRFGRARVRVGLPDGGSETIPWTADDVALDATCAARQVARALESVWPLAEQRLSSAWRDPAAPPTRAGIHALFPELESAIETSIREGRRQLATGRLAEARESFARATRIDPEHLDARSFLAEVETTLALSEQLARAERSDHAPAVTTGTEPNAGVRVLEPQLTTAEERALEQQLAAERRRREDLLATLELLERDRVAPTAGDVDGLRPGRLPPPDAKGPRRARAQLEAAAEDSRSEVPPALETRVLHAPNGELIARYYFAAGTDVPVLVEQDTQGDGRPDRWVAWADGHRRAVWEESRGDGVPDVLLVYEDRGRTLARIELTPVDRATPERVFVYRSGRLRSDFRDTDGDGRFDETQHFDPNGALTLRETDVNGDGRVDVRTAYEDGRMVRREIMNPELEGALAR